MNVHFSRFAGAVLLSLSGLALGAPQLIVPAPAAGGRERSPQAIAKSNGDIAVRFNLEEIASAAADSEVELTLPNATRHTYVLELTQAHGDGITSFIARHKDLGNRYRAIVTNGPSGSFAVFSTPNGEFRLVPGDGTHDWLIDMSTQPAEPPLAAYNDARFPTETMQKAAPLHQASTFIAIPGVNALPRAKTTPVPQAVIDLMFVYTNGLAANLGPALMTRLNFLVTRANTAYADSHVAITLRLVRAVMVNYSDASDNDTALGEITPFVGNPNFNAAAFGGIEAQRTAAGADMVAFVRNGDSFGGAGLAWVGFQALDATRMYSVTTGCVSGCESVFIHEVGHNMGNMHDRNTVAWQDSTPPLNTGAFPYSYGYAFCKSGALTCNPTPGGGQCGVNQPECSTNDPSNFADIMAYFHQSTELIYKFSNQDADIACVASGGDQALRFCGVADPAANSADTRTSMNNMRMALSALKASVTGSSLPGSIQFTTNLVLASEGGNAALSVSRAGYTAGSEPAVSVQFATADGTALAGLDYSSTSGTLNWGALDPSAKPITVPIQNDGASENGEYFTVTLSNPGVTTGVYLGSPSVATVIVPGTNQWPPANALPAGWLTPDGSGGPWTAVTDQAFEGTHSLRSHNVLSPDQIAFANSDLTTTPIAMSAGNIVFAYNVSALPGYGILEFFVDGVSVFSATDTFPDNWRAAVIPVAAGTHTLRWRFKNRLNFECRFTTQPRGAQCADRAWIDAVMLPVALPASTTSLGSSLNPSASGQSVTITATVSGASGTPTGAVTFRNGGVNIAGCVAVAMTTAQAGCTTSALPVGANSITGVYSGNATYGTSTSSPLIQNVTSGPQLFSANPATLAFGGQSMNTTSPSQPTTITNTSGGPVTITGITASTGYAVTHNCPATPMANAATCVVDATFTPPPGPATGPYNGSISITYAGGGPTIVNLTGTAEKTLVTHFYRAILRRAPDAPGKAFWESEAARMQTIGANINESWFAMAQFFFFSAEYTSFARNNTGFVTDLYVTFFNRQPDGGGLNFWVAELTSGVPREVVLAAFMFSTEFANFTQAIFGNTAVRAEVNMVMDFYRGLLARLPDPGGFTAWVNNFRDVQCGRFPLPGGAAGNTVNTMAEAISSGFALGGEYTGKNRTNAQYVGDLYNAFLRRGGDLGGVNFWVNDLNAATRTRENVRQNFIASPEFQARVTAVVNQGCLP